MSDEKRLIGNALFPVALATLGSAHVAGYGAGLPRTEETVHEHRNIAMIRRALDVYNSGDDNAMRGFLADDIVWHVGGNHEMSGDYIGIEVVVDYFRRVRRETAGTLQVEPAEILANDRHASIFMKVSAYRDVRWMDVLLAEALTLDPNGRWTEYWALANDQDAVDAFWS
jgi:ketosteroid isomerase-like protein